MEVELSEREIKVLTNCCDCTYHIGELDAKQSKEIKTIWEKLQTLLVSQPIR